MRKSLRITALVLALMTLLSMATFAADTQSDPVVTPVGSNTTAAFDANKEKVTLTYTNDVIKAGNFYLILMLKADATQITKDTILYIDQITAAEDGKLTFTVYPETMKNGAIMVVANGLADETSLAGVTIANVGGIIEITYILGDVNGDGKIVGGDAMLTARRSVKLPLAVAFNDDAADVNGDGRITGSDAMLIARYAVGLIKEFPKA